MYIFDERDEKESILCPINEYIQHTAFISFYFFYLIQIARKSGHKLSFSAIYQPLILFHFLIYRKFYFLYTRIFLMEIDWEAYLRVNLNTEKCLQNFH